MNEIKLETELQNIKPLIFTLVLYEDPNVCGYVYISVGGSILDVKSICT